jgi:hypothetical protein
VWLNFADSFVATNVPLAEPPIGVNATSEFTFSAASLPQGDQMDSATSSCLV